MWFTSCGKIVLLPATKTTVEKNDDPVSGETQMIKKLILICALLPLIASCAFKAADFGLSEEEFNARIKQYYSICEGRGGGATVLMEAHLVS